MVLEKVLLRPPIQQIDGCENSLVNRWISLEDDPEIVANDGLLLVTEVDEFLNASVGDTAMSIS